MIHLLLVWAFCVSIYGIVVGYLNLRDPGTTEWERLDLIRFIALFAVGLFFTIGVCVELYIYAY